MEGSRFIGPESSDDEIRASAARFAEDLRSGAATARRSEAIRKAVLGDGSDGFDLGNGSHDREPRNPAPASGAGGAELPLPDGSNTGVQE